MGLEDQTDHREEAKPKQIGQKLGAASSADPNPQNPLWEQSALPFHEGETANGPYETTSTTPPQAFFQSLSTSHFGRP